MAEVAEIVADVRARGDAALREWSLRLDGVEPACAIPAGDLPEQALHDLADRVRRWHEAQRPPDVLSRSSRAWSSSAAGFRSRRSGSTSRAH